MDFGLLMAIIINVFAASLNFTIAAINYSNKNFGMLPINIGCGIISSSVTIYLLTLFLG